MTLLPGVLLTLFVAITSQPPNLEVGSPFTLSASTGGLVASSSYYLKIRIGSTSATMTKGQTFNNQNDSPDDWLSDGTDWTLFPTFLTNFSGVWSGEITGRPGDGVTPGQNYLTVRIRKVGASTNSDSASVAAVINASSASSQTSDNSQETKLPGVTFDLGSNYALGQTFGANVALADFDPNTEFYLKVRGGTEETLLNKVQTKSGESFLGDTESWTKLPLIKTDGEGKWGGQVEAVLGEDKPEGKYKIRLRVHKKDADTSFDSSIREVTFQKPAVTADQSSTAVLATATSNVSDLLEEDEETATGTELVLDLPQEILGESTMSSSLAAIPKSFPGEPLPLILSGGIALSLAFLYNTIRHIWLRKISI